MAPAGTGGEPSAQLEKAIEASFGSQEAMEQQFSGVAAARFGPGWAWLILKPGGGSWPSPATPTRTTP